MDGFGEKRVVCVRFLVLIFSVCFVGSFVRLFICFCCYCCFSHTRAVLRSALYKCTVHLVTADSFTSGDCCV